MNIKKMMLISILLAILTIGAVSASEDVDDALTVEDGGVDDVSTSVEDDGAILEDDGDNTNPENPQVEVKKEDFNVEIKNQFNLSDEDDYAISYSCSNNVSEGIIYVSVNNEEFIEKFDISQETIKLNNNDLYFRGFYEYFIDVYYCAPGVEGTDGLKLASGTVNVIKNLEKNDFEMFYDDGQIVDLRKNNIIFYSNTVVNGTFIVTTDKGQEYQYKLEKFTYDYVDIEKLGITEKGTYEINVKFTSDDGIELDLATFTITVKKAGVIKLTLKKVKVKKSAKKLVLTATLKINGKNAKKGTKVTFKFNGKTYKARTNAKGVAKVTIKKKVLKKLKVGKKVKYQVSYGKKTVKRTVKVKR